MEKRMRNKIRHAMAHLGMRPTITLLWAVLLLTVGIAAFGQTAAPAVPPAEAPPAPAINTGDTAWLLVSTALVMLMTPGLALFYGGMVRAKNVLNMLMKS